MNQPRRRYESFRNPLFQIALLVCLLAAVALTIKDGFSPTGPIRFYTTDNPIPPDNEGREVVQLLLYMLAFAIGLGLAVYHKQRRWFFLFYGLYFFVFAMEESDWLQQILHYPTPEFFREHNTREAVNIHNFALGGRRIVGQLLSRLILGAPVVVFLIAALVRAVKKQFLGKLVWAALALSISLDFFPRHAVFQLFFAVFVVAYPLIVVSVDYEREELADSERPPPAEDETPPAERA